MQTLAGKSEDASGTARNSAKSKQRPPGARPEHLLQMAGSIPAADCEEMIKAIDEGCGQVNVNAW
jgi:hypothetical protein